MSKIPLHRLLFSFSTGIIFVITGSVASTTYAAKDSGSFSGSWVANGSKESLALGNNRTASLFRLKGHVNLHDNVGKERDYWSECIGLADSAAGATVRCVWTSLQGQQIYLVLEAEGMQQGSMVTGNIVGGTLDAMGITGKLSFKWSSMATHLENTKTAIGGYAKDLSGTYQIP